MPAVRVRLRRKPPTPLVGSWDEKPASSGSFSKPTGCGEREGKRIHHSRNQFSLEREYGSTTSRGRENVGGALKAGKWEMLFFGEIRGLKGIVVEKTGIPRNSWWLDRLSAGRRDRF